MLVPLGLLIFITRSSRGLRTPFFPKALLDDAKEQPDLPALAADGAKAGSMTWLDHAFFIIGINYDVEGECIILSAPAWGQ